MPTIILSGPMSIPGAPRARVRPAFASARVEPLEGRLHLSAAPIFNEDFAQPAGARPSTGTWKYNTGTDPNNGNVSYVDDAASLGVVADAGAADGKALAMSIRRDPANANRFLSARINTSIDPVAGHLLYGRIEARIKLPGGPDGAGNGLWPAFWMLGSNFPQVGWPACGEIDVMENAGSRPGQNQGTIHGTDYAGAGVTSYYNLPAGQAFYSAYHVFAIDWRPGSVRFSVDGHAYSTMTPASLPAGSPWLFDHPFYLILNVNAGGSFGGPVGATTVFPQTMLVDYVRAYAPPVVTGRSVFYNDSAFDGADPAAAPSDDGAIAPDKVALRPGSAASFSNVTSDPRGINGMMIDVLGPPAATSPSLNDFTFLTSPGGPAPAWTNAPPPRAMTVRRSAGAGGADRITFVWDDAGSPGANAAVANAWLQVTFKADANTGVVAADVFSFGNLIAETGDAASPLRVSTPDLATIRAAQNQPATITTPADINRDGRVNALDLAAARRSLGNSLLPADPGAAAPTVLQAAIRPLSTPLIDTRAVRRRRPEVMSIMA